MSSTIAIDFGTTNTVVAEWIEASRSPETIVLDGLSYRFQGGPPAVPSLVYVDDVEANAYRVGFTVLSQGLHESPEAGARLYSSMKRGLLGDRSISRALPAHRPITPEQAAEVFLDSITRAILATGRTISELVLTAPVMAFEVYLRWLAKTVRGLVSIENAPLRIIDEPTAAAFGYGIDSPGGHVLVIDFGGGTLNLSLVRLPDDLDASRRGIVISPGANPESSAAMQRDRVRARVIAKESCSLGGDDIDGVLVDLLLEKTGLTRQAVLDDLPGLKRAAEEAKKELSSAEECDIHYYLRMLRKSIHYTLTRVEFEQQVLNAPHLEALNTLRRQIDHLLKEAETRDIGTNQIDWILLVGGTTLIPAVRKLIEERFTPERIRQQRPFEAVAHGALGLVKSCPIDDILHHSYALEVKQIQIVEKSAAISPMTPTEVQPPTAKPAFSLLEFLGLKAPKPAGMSTARPQTAQVLVVQAARYDYMILIRAGTVYPLENPIYLCHHLQPAHDHATQIDFVVAEVSETESPGLRQVLDSRGTILPERGEAWVEHAQTIRLLSDKYSVRLDPPGQLTETDRLDVSFNVDENRQLRLTVLDRVARRYLLFDEPVIKLE